MAEVIGHFEQAVLVALVRLGSEAYGRAILNEVQKRLEREISAGAVYATLERLEAKGFALSRLAPGTAMFCGTFAVHGGISTSGAFEMELDDPVLKRKLSHSYRIVSLPDEG